MMLPTHRATHTQKCDRCKGPINTGDVLRQERLPAATIKEKCGLIRTPMLKTCANCLWFNASFCLYNGWRKEVISYIRISYVNFWEDLQTALENTPRGTFLDIGKVRCSPDWKTKGHWECDPTE